MNKLAYQQIGKKKILKNQLNKLFLMEFQLKNYKYKKINICIYLLIIRYLKIINKKKNLCIMK